ncbi:hypothetical protein H206_05320 [Candidatus Electrothrix aarhusensis]|uniref:Transposase n=1 Tax=Candidatus Electrothrix aarhusensis TaxID=1859131 RepID=A0A3S3QUK6_9BACT|nr:hypothetical protein H206_05320 [Candidatus Electrothrix aarhusensis]
MKIKFQNGQHFVRVDAVKENGYRVGCCTAATQLGVTPHAI